MAKKNIGNSLLNEETKIIRDSSHYELSVIVPMYNIEDYLGEALNSLLNQSLAKNSLQVILIDDGSTDQTTNIAQAYVKQYPEIFELHEVVSYGAGKIRNYGIQLAKGQYVTFFDADDIVEPQAYSIALEHIKQTNSQILLGRIKRFNTTKSWLSEIHNMIKVTDKKDKVSIDSQPNLVYYTTAWDKIYSLKFLKEFDIKFSEGKIYEDLLFTNAAYMHAESIDITDIPFYKWRSRDNGQASDTQKTDDILPLVNRNDALIETFNELVKHHASQINIEAYLKKAFDFDLPIMFRRLKHIDLLSEADLKTVYAKTILVLDKLNFKENKFVTNITALSLLSAMYDAKSFEEFLSIFRKYVRQEVNYSGEWVDDKWTLKTDLSPVTKIADSFDLKMHTKVEDINWLEDTLVVQGFVYAEHSDMSKLDCIKDPQVTLYDANNMLLAKNVANVQFFENKNITAKFGYNTSHFNKDGADFNYDFSGYIIKIPIKTLAVKTERITLKLSFYLDGQFVSTMIGFPTTQVSLKNKIKIYQSSNIAFAIEHSEPDWLMNIKPQIDIDILDYQDARVKLVNKSKKIYLYNGKKFIAANAFIQRLMSSSKVYKLFNKYGKMTEGKWYLVTKNNGVAKPLYLDENINVSNKNQIFKFLATDNGRALLDIKWNDSRILKINVDANILRIDFELLGYREGLKRVKVRADRKVPKIAWPAKKIGNQRYRLTIPLEFDGFGEREWLNFQLILKFADGRKEFSLLKWGNKTFDLEGQTLNINNINWTFRRVPHVNGGFAIKRTADRVYRNKIGSLDRYLETEYQAFLKQPLLENTIVWSAYWGRDNKFNGNPRALYDYVATHYNNFKHIIVVSNVVQEFKDIKDNTKVISFGTKEYWYYLARAKYFVNDVNFTQNERQKRDGQIEIQTMHGTPLKTMGFDVISEWTDASYNKMHKRFKNYDYLVVPSDWVAQYATRSFNINPKILKTGYPRNDEFFVQHTQSEIDLIKEQFKLPLDKKVVLYTPTYRIKDEKVSLEQRFEDIDALYNVLGDDKILVIKNHNFDHYKMLPKNYRDKIFIVNPYSEINDLYIISDVLITDYSSVMFDYALLQKPMIFWAFDYEEYVAKRGINFDLQSEAPGPFIKKQAELEKWILNYKDIMSTYENNIANFKRKFSQYDNGTASEQIAQVIFADQAKINK